LLGATRLLTISTSSPMVQV